jgi:hypothetical protein
MTAYSAPWIYNDSDDIGPVDWEPWGFGTGFVLFNLAVVKWPPEDEAGFSAATKSALINSMEGAFLLFWDILQFVEDKKTDPATDVGFASNLFTAVPSLINAIKLVPDYGQVIAATADIVCYLCNAVLCFYQAAALGAYQASSK